MQVSCASHVQPVYTALVVTESDDTSAIIQFLKGGTSWCWNKLATSQVGMVSTLIKDDAFGPSCKKQLWRQSRQIIRPSKKKGVFPRALMSSTWYAWWLMKKFNHSAFHHGEGYHFVAEREPRMKHIMWTDVTEPFLEPREMIEIVRS